jgi:hypothetical protein
LRAALTVSVRRDAVTGHTTVSVGLRLDIDMLPQEQEEFTAARPASWRSGEAPERCPVRFGQVRRLSPLRIGVNDSP